MHRRPFTTQDAYSSARTHEYLRHALRKGRIQRIGRGIYIEGREPPTSIELALGLVVATKGVASGTLAGILHELDSITLKGSVTTVPSNRSTRLRNVRRTDMPDNHVTQVDGYHCIDGFQTMVDLATHLDDLRWEQALESALRKHLFTLDKLESIDNVRGAKRMRRVLSLRPPNAPPTESLLETLTVQLVRTEPRLPTPERQVVVNDRWDRFVARVDLAWPKHGIFLELDGQQHKDQPVYDANRQTAVVATTGWLPGRFTWREITRAQRFTLRRLIELFEQSSRLRRPA